MRIYKKMTTQCGGRGCNNLRQSINSGLNCLWSHYQGLAAFPRHYQLNIVHDHFQVIWVLNSTSQTPYTGCPKKWLTECNWSPKILTKNECCLQSFGSCTYYVITFGSPEQFVISCLNLDLSVQKCDYLQDQEVNLRNLAYILPGVLCCKRNDVGSARDPIVCRPPIAAYWSPGRLHCSLLHCQ